MSKVKIVRSDEAIIYICILHICECYPKRINATQGSHLDEPETKNVRYNESPVSLSVAYFYLQLARQIGNFLTLLPGNSSRQDKQAHRRCRQDRWVMWV